jgi:hypothetical protein
LRLRSGGPRRANRSATREDSLSSELISRLDAIVAEPIERHAQEIGAESAALDSADRALAALWPMLDSV